MMKAVANNTNQPAGNNTSGSCARFEPIQKILARWDEKTVERAPMTSKMAA